MREVRRDQYGIRSVWGVEGVPIKFEIVSEGRIAIDGKHHPQLGVPTLNTESLFAEKLLANADRWADASVLSRDMIDVGFMLITTARQAPGLFALGAKGLAHTRPHRNRAESSNKLSRRLWRRANVL